MVVGNQSAGQVCSSRVRTGGHAHPVRGGEEMSVRADGDKTGNSLAWP